MTTKRDIVEQWLANVASKSRGRTRYEGQEPYWDEVIAAEINALRAEVERLEARKAELEDTLRNYVP